MWCVLHNSVCTWIMGPLEVILAHFYSLGCATNKRQGDGPGIELRINYYLEIMLANDDNEKGVGQVSAGRQTKNKSKYNLKGRLLLYPK